MAVLHEDEEPDFWVLCSLVDTGPGRCLASVGDSVALRALVSEETLLFSEPSGSQWLVGENEDGTNGNN
jgi:hypothetical protein